jgi:hypothetical protein
MKTSWSRRRLTSHLWSLAMVTAIVAVVVSLVSSAHAAPVPVTDGFLDWGFKDSFRSYITGPIAHGAISVSGGATQNTNGTFHFSPAGSGSHDSVAATTSAAFAGGVRFTGHDGELDMTISNVRVQLTGTSGTLIFDIETLSQGQLQDFPSTAFATLNLAGISPVTSGNTVSWSNIPTTLTAAGADAFAGFYFPGQALDPASFTLVLGAASTATGTATPTATSTTALTSTATATPTLAATSSPTATSTPAATGTGTPIATTTPAATATTPPIPTNGLTWKVSQSAWTSSSLSPAHAAGPPAVKDPNNGFVFPAGQATYNPATGATSADFQGSLTLGNVVQGGFRIRLANPSVVIDAQRAGTLSADVSSCVPTAGSPSQTFCDDPSNFSVPVRATVVTFTADPAAITDTGSRVSWSFTPDYPLQNDPANPTRRQFPQSFLNALPTSLQPFFRDTGGAGDVNKPPAPLSASFSYVAAPTTTTTTSPTLTRTATVTRTPTATTTLPVPTTALPTATSTTTFGGRGFTLTSLGGGQARLSWSSGTGHTGYRLLRLTSVGETPIAELPSSATSFVDSLPASFIVACYRLSVLGSGGAPVASGDVLCLMDISTGTPATDFSARLNQSNVATFSWGPPAGGGQTSFALVPLGAVRSQLLPASASSATDNTNGVATGYLVAAGGPNGFIGFTDVIFVVPGAAMNL